MNILLWTLQIGLALYALMGGSWTVKTAGKLGAGDHARLPSSAWVTLGALQMLFALGLIVPGAFRILPGLTALAALCLAVEMVGTASILLAPKRLMSSGMLWAAIPALLAAFVAYGRWTLIPL